MILLVMVFRRRFNSLRPVNRIKHVVDIQSAMVAGTGETQSLIIALDNPTQANVKDVQNGCTINGFYLVLEAVATSSAALSNFYLMVVKNVGNNLTIPEPNAVGVDDVKRFVVHQEMVMLQRQTNSNPRTVFKGVIVVPRHLRRMAPADRWQIRVLAPGVNTDYCLQVHFKEFR